MKNLVCNENGHGIVPSTKDVLKIVGVLVTFPVSIPVIILKEKLKKKKEESKK